MDSLNPSISNYLLNKLPQLNPIIETKAIRGGDISSCFKISSTDFSIFLKVNSAKHSKMFQLEAEALHFLDSKSNFKIPKVLDQGSTSDFSFLVLEFLNLRNNNLNFQGLGKCLADLHRNTSDSMGFENDNFIATLKQNNRPCADWVEFYISNRLIFQFKISYDQAVFNHQDFNNFNSFCLKLGEIIPKEKPALLHGDFWSGNYAQDEIGNHVIYDPAIYYGHREMDLAMMKLFGGFENVVFEEYQQNFPLEGNFAERIPIHQLYPILVHVNLFGGYYSQQARSIWKNFI